MTDRASGNARGVVVMIAYYAPPAVGIAAQRLVGFARHLPDLGWDPVIVAPADVHFHRTAGERQVDLPDVIRVRNPEPSRWLRGLVGSSDVGSSDVGATTEGVEELRPAPGGPLTDVLRRMVHEWLYVPDAQALWIPGAAAAAARAVRSARGRPTLVFSTSVPFSAHFAAWRTAAAEGVPWVAEYRDPWSVAPPQFGTRSRLRQLVDRRMDESIARRADHVVVTSEHTRGLFLDAFTGMDATHVSVVRNGWEPVTPGVTERPPTPAAPLTLMYAGGLLQPAWGEAFLRGVESVLADEPGSVRVEILGPTDRWAGVADRGDRPGFVRLHGMIAGALVPRKLQGASALVILQPDAVRYVPGKVYEYLGARRPILAALPSASEAAGLVRRHGDARLVDPLDPAEIARSVRALLDEHRAGALQGPTVTEDVIEPLGRRAQAARLAHTFDALVNR